MTKAARIDLDITHITSARVSLTKTNHTWVPDFKEGRKRNPLRAWQKKGNTGGQHNDDHAIQSSSDAESPSNSPTGFNPAFT